MDFSTIPQENMIIVSQLYIIETALRELIIEQLEKTCGSKWYKQRLPQGIYEKFREGIKYERTISWLQLVPHHPIYYIDFPHLKEIICRKDNWNDVFKAIFNREEVIAGTLAEIVPIRNKIAHNRKASRHDVILVQSAADKLAEMIGSTRFEELSLKCSIAVDILDRIRVLQHECDKSFKKMNKVERVPVLVNWDSVKNEWWFEESEVYLGSGLTEVKLFFEILELYYTLPRKRGNGYEIEIWLHEKDIQTQYRKAQEEFNALINKGEE